MRTAGAAQSVGEFAASIQDFAGLSTAIQTDLLAYYLNVILGRTSVTAAELSELRLQLQLSPHKSLPAYLSNGTRKAKDKPAKYVRAERGYLVERAYQITLAVHMGRAAAKVVARDLRAELSKVKDPDESAYLLEAVECFEYSLFRGAIVLTWCVAYSRFRSWVFDKHLPAFNAVTATWKSPTTIKLVEDFQELNEGTVIETARKAGFVTKELYKTLKHLLDQRNSYAHPSHKPIRSSIAEAYIETTLQEVVIKLV